MQQRVSELAYSGDWNGLLSILEVRPELVNISKQPNGYTPLHQAAWHGAPSPVIHRLLVLGADPSITTASKFQTPQEISLEKHPTRLDLDYLLSVPKPSLSRVVRKVVSDTTSLFGAYDGNQFVYNRIVESLVVEPRFASVRDLHERFDLLVAAISGLCASGATEREFDLSEYFCLQTDSVFWERTLVPLVHDALRRQATYPLERVWASVADLFDPAPRQWGLRGDLFLWIELRQALCHVPIPAQEGALEQVIRCAYEALVGRPIDSSAEVYVPRLARGGMSSGMVSPEFWSRSFIPMLEQRASWLNVAWG
ncbi:ankyrin repeat domain-containing protein [Pseudomonas japonica]|uniref:ankyrin repeat domain-containing protein n=1 Tax=Pseudomonas japonica TaxID=256466 RepID=UPI0015E2A751|nr:ankyrin repeat domain-containing protein [Pseudomonas japonica]MBA1245828.1 ankyrin repeat domain-containing protein [Pseudomonas japonica]